MANVFDQFDAAPAPVKPVGNVFDQFDAPVAGHVGVPAAPAAPMSTAADAAASFASGVPRGLIESIMSPLTLNKLANDASGWLYDKGESGVRAAFGMDPAVPGPDSAVKKAIVSPVSAGVDAVRSLFGEAPIQQGFDATQDVVRTAMDDTLHKPQTRTGKVFGTIGEFVAPGGLPSRAARMAPTIGSRVGRYIEDLTGNVVAPALLSEGGGQAFEGGPLEGPARLLGALFGNAGTAGIRAANAPEAVVRRATSDMTDADWARAIGLQDNPTGVRLTGPEAIAQATGGASALPNVQRLVEGSSPGRAQTGPFFAARPGQVDTAVGNVLDQIAPQSPQPSTLGPRAAEAADNVIGGVRQDINAETRPLYQAAEPRLVSLRDDPGVLLGDALPGDSHLVNGPIEDAMGAIKFRGKVYSGPSHADAMQKIVDTVGKKDPTVAADLEKLGLTDFGKISEGRFRGSNHDAQLRSQNKRLYGRDVDGFVNVGAEVRDRVKGGMKVPQAFADVAEKYRAEGKARGVRYGENERYMAEEFERPKTPAAPVSDDPRFQAAVARLRANPELGPEYAHLPDNSVAVIDAATKDMMARGEALRDTANPLYGPELAARNVESAATARNAATTQSPEYAQALAVQEALRRAILDPVQQGPVGRVAAANTTESAGNAILPHDPEPGSGGETADAMARLIMEDPGTTRGLVRQNLGKRYSKAATETMGGDTTFSGAKFHKDVAGNVDRREVLDAVMRAVGQQPAAAMEQLLPVLQATGRRKPIGSATEFNRMDAAELGAASPRATVLDLLGSLGTSYFTKFGDATKRAMMRGNLGTLAELFTDPHSVELIRNAVNRGAGINLGEAAGRTAAEAGTTLFDPRGGR